MYMTHKENHLNNTAVRKTRYDIVLLDADETIFDFKRAEDHSIRLLMQSYGVTPTKDLVSQYSAINLALWKALERGEMTREKLKVLRFKRFFEKIGVSGVDYIEANDRYLTNLSNSTFLIDGAADFVKELHKHCRIYLATNGLTKAQKGRFSKSEIKDDFDGAFISEQIGFAKPDKTYFEYIFKAVGVQDKSRVIIVGDSLTSDMLGGRNAGIDTCLFSRSGEYVESDLCDYQIADYNDFFGILFE